ncbi:heavy metal efflux pump, partial [Striga asiatica]
YEEKAVDEQVSGGRLTPSSYEFRVWFEGRIDSGHSSFMGGYRFKRWIGPVIGESFWSRSIGLAEVPSDLSGIGTSSPNIGNLLFKISGAKKKKQAKEFRDRERYQGKVRSKGDDQARTSGIRERHLSGIGIFSSVLGIGDRYTSRPCVITTFRLNPNTPSKELPPNCPYLPSSDRDKECRLEAEKTIESHFCVWVWFRNAPSQAQGRVPPAHEGPFARLFTQTFETPSTPFHGRLSVLLLV